MAKLELKTINEQKAKKRKHSNAGQEDEVANKSVIVEDLSPQEFGGACKPKEISEQGTSKASKKRKNKDKGAIRDKRPKSAELVVDDHEQLVETNADHDEDDLHQPTIEELKESEKPENNLAIVTGRQKKLQKRQKLIEVQKTQSFEREKQRNEDYLKKWKNSRGEWKFEKLRQISIQQTMFEEDKLSANVWPIALEYLAGSKGAAKDKILNIANNIIDGIDKKCEQLELEDEQQDLLNSVKYQRARDLLQTFD